jgi:hypothetical protein
MSAMKQAPRWMVENDPLWEKVYDTDPGTLKWKRKGTSLIALCPQTSVVCDIVDSVAGNGSMFDLEGDIAEYYNRFRGTPALASDIRKYLSSRYLNSQYGIDNNNSIIQTRKRISFGDQSR